VREGELQAHAKTKTEAEKIVAVGAVERRRCFESFDEVYFRMLILTTMA